MLPYMDVVPCSIQEWDMEYLDGWVLRLDGFISIISHEQSLSSLMTGRYLKAVLFGVRE